MTDARRALVFIDAGSNLDHLASALKEADLQPALPYELATNPGEVSIVIVERPALNAVAICANLRRQGDFKDVPMLVLVESADPDQVAQLTTLGADLFFKPVVPKALSRYLITKVPLIVTQSKSGDSPGARRRGRKKETESLGRPARLDQSAGSDTATEAGQKNNGKTGQPVPPVLDDLIPTSNRLLPTGIVDAMIAKGGIRCGECGRWRARREDAFCSKCGKALSILEVPNTVVFEPLGEHRVGQLIEVENGGQNPLRLGFDIIADKELARRFDLHTAASNLEGGYAEHLLVTFDAIGLDLTTSYQAVLEITSNAGGYSKHPLALFVDRLPIPRLVTDETYTYVLGVENEWKLKLANDGGGTLTLAGIRLIDLGNDPQPSAIELELLKHTVIKGGQSSVVRVRLPELDLSPGRSAKRLVCGFEHHKSVEVGIAISAIRPARLAVQPPEIDFGVVSTHRSGKLSLQFVNGGGEELTIDSVTPSVDWLDCPVETPRTIHPGTALVVDLQVHGAPERAGEHRGEIAIKSNSYEDELQTIPFTAKFVEPGPYEAYIGIDFGTTASCVAILDKNDQAFVIQLDSVTPNSNSDPRLMPSVLFFQPDGSVLAGSEALDNAGIEPANAVTSIKRILGSKQKKKLAGREFDPTQLTSKVLDQLLLRTERALFELGDYTTPRRAIVTVPVEVFDNQRRAMLDACQIAGLEVHSFSKHGIVIDEAHAAALHYLSKKGPVASGSESERVLIFDFGGGTLDCALIEIEVTADKVRLKTLAPGGDPRLGGDDIDWALARLLGEKAKEKYPDFDMNCLSEEQVFNRRFGNTKIDSQARGIRRIFKQKAESAKITLANLPAFEFSIWPLLRQDATPLSPYIMNGQGPAQVEVTVEQEELKAVVEPFLVRAASLVETICQRAKVTPEDVHTILHVGRTSLLPMVRERINKLLPNAEDRSEVIEPKLCVALGAAFWGQIKDQPHSNFEFVGGANRLLHDIGYIDFNTVLLKQVFATVFPSQTEFPCETTIEFPVNKETITLRLAENRGSKDTIEHNLEIKRTGRARIDTAGAEGPTLAVKFAIDENRVLQITANGETQNIELVDE
jgi:molecular chaperone DnaK